MSKSLEMRKKIDDWIDTVRQEYIDDVIGAVSIPSIAVCSQGKYPVKLVRGCWIIWRIVSKIWFQLY